MFEPLFWILERVAKKAGPIFVGLVILLTTSVVVNYYLYVLPWNSERWPSYYTALNYAFGHWLLLNIVFHYYMGVMTSPGKPPATVENPVSICKNCITAKPPRTHHCSVCKQCVLKMDHHCPWLNNCVGFYNHRYFFLFCVYMCSGTIFVTCSIYCQFRTYFTGTPANFLASLSMPLYSVFIANVAPTTSSTVEIQQPGVIVPPILPLTEDELRTRFWVVYEFFLCAGVTVALGGLTLWHARLISKGETSIEKHINIREAKRAAELGATYVNPYDYGFVENWKVFFGIEAGTNRSWRHVLLPSRHMPTGDGKVWPRHGVTSKSD